jgi:hypothetical protein
VLEEVDVLRHQRLHLHRDVVAVPHQRDVEARDVGDGVEHERQGVAAELGVAERSLDADALLDTIVLVTLFGIYMYFTSKVESEHVELVGPAKAMGAMSDAPRRIAVLALLIFSAVTIFSAAEPFAEFPVVTFKT